MCVSVHLFEYVSVCIFQGEGAKYKMEGMCWKKQEKVVLVARVNCRSIGRTVGSDDLESRSGFLI